MGCFISMLYIFALELEPDLNQSRINFEARTIETPPKSAAPLKALLAAYFIARIIETGNVIASLGSD